MAEKKEEGLDIWDIALPVGGAMLGRLGGRAAARSTKKGSKYYKDHQSAVSTREKAYSDWKAEYDASSKILRDHGSGVIKLSPKEELYHRRVVSGGPSKTTPALDDAHSAEYQAWDKMGSHRLKFSVPGTVVGGYAGYKGNQERRKRRK